LTFFSIFKSRHLTNLNKGKTRTYKDIVPILKEQKNLNVMKLFFLILCFISIVQHVIAQKINLKINSDVAYFTEGKDSILSYQIVAKSFNGTYKRSNYIHPLYTLDGQILTEDFPLDHLHHRGVFWAWHQLYIGNKRLGNAWEIKDFSWEIKSVVEIKNLIEARAIKAQILWKSNQWLDDNGNEKAVVKEIIKIKVYKKNTDYRKIDISISMIALEPNVRIGGSKNEKGYGGFSTRIRLTKDIRFSSSEGIVEPNKLPVKANGWMDISGSFGKNGTQAGLSILCHPSNPEPSNYWILRSKKSMQNAVYPFPGATTVSLSLKEPTILRYCLIIHNNSKSLDIKALYNDYCKE
jgi:hypothetical protein